MKQALFCLLAAAGLAAGGELKRDEEVIFFPTLARRVTNGWELAIHGWVFEPEQRKLAQSLFRRVVGLDEGELRAAEKAAFQERTQLFLVDNERMKALTLRLGETTRVLETSKAHGHFTARVLLSLEEVQRSGLSSGSNIFTLAAEGSKLRSFPGAVRFLDDTGLSVISDIDDTIKVTDVLKKKEMLRNTFCRPFQAVPGMAAVYQSWARSAGAEFHYVSASPWQLYPQLADFTRTNGFPGGTFELRFFRVRDGTFLKLFDSPEQYKTSVIAPLLEKFPKRRFVLVGDSGERDPEIYGAIARKFPRQVERIFIRDVTNEDADSKRYRKTFEGLSGDLWKIFKEPPEIERLLNPGKPGIQP